ncbi:hypothetical protein Dimus_038229 [Dionaea muscipula]
MTVGREHELPQETTDQPAKEGEHDTTLSIDDTNLIKFMAGLDSIMTLDDEVQEVAPHKDTSGDVESEKAEAEPVASSPKRKRTLKKKGEQEAEAEVVATGKEVGLAPQPSVAMGDRGRTTRSKKCETEKKKLLSLDLPTTLLPTNHPDHTTYEPPKRSILPSDSMLLCTGKEKDERHQMRVQWARESITEKDKDLAEHMTDVQLRQWTTHAAAQVIAFSFVNFLASFMASIY